MSELIRWEPFRRLPVFPGRLNSIFDNFFGGQGYGVDEPLSEGLWNPSVDVYETTDNIVLKAEIPEVDEKDVDISVQANTLTLRGERKRDREVKEDSYYRKERSYGSFRRSFALPDSIDPEKIQASFSKGVLKVTLPKREESKPKQFKVKIKREN